MIKRVALVYQVGLANVFQLAVGGGGREQRVMQADYRSCELYVRGMRDAGAEVHVYHCDAAGDIAHLLWADGPGDLWREKKHPPVDGR